MSTISFDWPAAYGTVFATDAWESQIGNTIQVDFGGVGERGRLLDAQVAEDGKSVRLTLEVEDDDDTLRRANPALGRRINTAAFRTALSAASLPKRQTEGQG